MTMKIKKVLINLPLLFFLLNSLSFIKCKGDIQADKLIKVEYQKKIYKQKDKESKNISTKVDKDNKEKDKEDDSKSQAEESKNQRIKFIWAMQDTIDKLNEKLAIQQNELQEMQKKLQSESSHLFFYILGGLTLLFIETLLLLIAFIKLKQRKTQILELVDANKKLKEKINNMQSLDSSRMSRTISIAGSSLLQSSSFNRGTEANSAPKPRSFQEFQSPITTSDLLSPLYSDKKRRDERKMRDEADVFLDIAQVMYVQMQRGERITTVLLEKQGTWRNSTFVVIGKSLYINFYLYNETRPFFLDSSQTKEFMHLIYDIKGEGNVIKCSPATVNMVKNGYCVIDKGKLLLE